MQHFHNTNNYTQAHTLSLFLSPGLNRTHFAFKKQCNIFVSNKYNASSRHSS
eukprot:m.46942 g.46942  ORF g.46942 m.46942 type:complete len:52 (-) comp10736_c0_seq6:1146-1301(-)